jgi:hypothetical protein
MNPQTNRVEPVLDVLAVFFAMDLIGLAFVVDLEGLDGVALCFNALLNCGFRHPLFLGHAA